MRMSFARRCIIFIITSVVMIVSIIATTPNAGADILPTVKWPAVDLDSSILPMPPVISPQGDLTLGCEHRGGSDYTNLKTYDTAGTVIRDFSATTQVNGVNNCISRPVVDKNGDLYGFANGGSHILAYSGSTLKWTYQLDCLPNKFAQ